MSWIDLTFKEPAGSVTKDAKNHGLSTQIVEKVPAWDMVVMRLTGDRAAIELFLDGHFTEAWIAKMHKPAIKDSDIAPLGRLKDRKLRENRA